MAETVDGSLFVHMLGEGVRTLDANRQLVNDLNVFPIPDGDTGDNMLSTIASGFEAVAGLDNEPLEAVAARAAEGMLLGAKGNSGVILSRIFAGIAAGFSGSVSAGTNEFGKALESGVKEAYKAVQVPVEGTMLTVFREAVEKANATAFCGDTAEGGGQQSGKKQEITVDEYFDILWDEVKQSLERTPELLSVLKEAGVVDSGGAGIMYIVEGMVKVLRGEYSEASADSTHGGASRPRQQITDISKFTEDSELTFGYCTEFLLRMQNAKTDIENFDITPVCDWLNSIGESVVCFKDGSIIKVHVHTFNPGDVLNYFRRFGEFLTIKIENMNLQHNENTPGAEKAYGGAEKGPGTADAEMIRSTSEVALRTKVHKKFATVAVGAGEGIKETFRSLGVDAVVDGGQSMNPSAADFIEAFKNIDADHILVFPNNGNIILTARQAAGLYKDSDVRVVATRNIGAGYSALSMLDISSGDPDLITAQAEEIGNAALTAHVSVASRDAGLDGVSVHKGDYIGFTDERVYIDGPDPEAAALGLAEGVGAGDFDVVLVISGMSADGAKAEELTQKLAEKYRRTEFIHIDGGQPVYDYIMIFE